jgi:leucyl aminopeptidase
MFSNDDRLCDRLTTAGLATGERVWRMPLGPEYDKMIDSKFADMKNTGGRFGGSITAAQFLQRFVGKTPWAHLDVAGTAIKPGDVVTSQFGKTIEIINTDAEGRLILADALSYARRLNPSCVIDIATLTGAIVVALGHTATGLFGTDEALIAEIKAASERADERAWPLPLWDEYRELNKSDIADVKNSGGRPGGSISAGWFLREFVDGFPWAHLDIAGTAYTEREDASRVKGPTGTGVRLFSEFILARQG